MTSIMLLCLFAAMFALFVILFQAILIYIKRKIQGDEEMSRVSGFTSQIEEDIHILMRLSYKDNISRDQKLAIHRAVHAYSLREPQKPEIEEAIAEDGQVFKSWYCPNPDCGYVGNAEVVEIDEEAYCHACGQALDWSGMR